MAHLEWDLADHIALEIQMYLHACSTHGMITLAWVLSSVGGVRTPYIAVRSHPPSRWSHEIKGFVGI